MSFSSSPITPEGGKTIAAAVFERAEHLEFCNSRARSSNGNKKRTQQWAEVAEVYNREHPLVRKSVAQITEWWKGQKKRVKADRALIRRYESTTGGGVDAEMEVKKRQFEKDFGYVSGVILHLLAGTAAFTGIRGGVETSVSAAAALPSTKKEEQGKAAKKKVVKKENNSLFDEDEDMEPAMTAKNEVITLDNDDDVEIIDGISVSEKLTRSLAEGRASLVRAFSAASSSAMRARATALRDAVRKGEDKPEYGEPEYKRSKNEKFVTKRELQKTTRELQKTMSNGFDELKQLFGGQRVSPKMNNINVPPATTPPSLSDDDYE